MSAPVLVFSGYYMLFLAALFIFYGLGHVILWSAGLASGNGFYKAFFAKSLTGLTVSVILFSIVFTSFKTIHLGLILVALITAYEIYRAKKSRGLETPAQVSQSKSLKRSLIPLFILSLVIYSWFACLLIKWQGDFGYFMPDKDKVYYSNISLMLLQTGEENREGITNLYAENTGTAPYHYFDLWFNSMLSFFTRTPSLVVMYLLCFPIFNLLASAGVLSLFEKRGAIKPLHIIFSFLLLFVGGCYFTGEPKMVYAQNFSETPMEFMGEKFGIFYLFGILALLLFLDDLFVAALSVLLVFPILSISTLPGFAGGLLLFLLLAGLFKILSRPDALRLFLYLLAVVLFISFFYFFTGDMHANPYLKNGLRVYTDLDEMNFLSFKVTIAELLYRVKLYPWRTFLLHLPFLIPTIWMLRGNRSLKGLLMLVFCIYASSLLAFGIFYKLFDASQFYTNNLVFINLSLLLGAVLFISSGFERPLRVSRLLGISLIFFLLLGKIFFSWLAHEKNKSRNDLYGDEFLTAISVLNTKEKEQVAVLYTAQPGENMYSEDKNGLQVLYLSFMPGMLPAVDMNVFEMNDWSNDPPIAQIQKAYIRNSPFYRFVMGQVSRGDFKNIAQSKMDFIMEKKIKYLVLFKGAEAGNEIRPLVKKVIRDERSGHRFLVLNPVF